MIRKIIGSFSLIFAICLVVCCSTESTENHMPEIIELQPTSNSPIINNLSDKFLLQKITPLETCPQSLIGQVSKLVVTNNRIILIDNLSAEKVMVFDDSGKFLFNSGSKGKGPYELLKPIDFYVSENSLFILGGYLKKVIQFDLQTGKKLKEFNLDFHAYAIEALDNSNTAFINMLTRGVTLTKNKYEQVYTTTYNHFLDYVLPMTPLVKTNDGVLFHNYLSDSLFSIGKKNLSLRYIFQFGSHGFDKKELYGIKNPKVLVQKASKTNKSCFTSNIFISEQYTYLTYMNFEENNLVMHYVYDKRKQSGFYISSKMTTDNITNSKAPPIFSYVKGNRFHFIKSPDKIEDFLKKNNISWQNDDNPILITLKKI